MGTTGRILRSLLICVLMTGLALTTCGATQANKDVVLTLTTEGGREYIKTSFGRLASGKLRPECIAATDIPLPIRGFRSETEFKGDHVETSTGRELLFAPANPTAAAESLVIDDLVITAGPLVGTWKFKSATAVGNKGFFIQWKKDDRSSVRTFVPWAAIGGVGISRSQFDAPLCPE